VTSGQKVAIQRNSFGDVVAEYTAHVTGKVATIARDALSEPGARVLEILYDRMAPKHDTGISHEPGDDY
jgi:predicted deacylase